MLFSSLLLTAAVTLVEPAAAVAIAQPQTRATVASATLSSKRGLCYNQASMSKLFSFSGSKVSWMYDWTQTAGTGANTALQYIPMLWSDSTANTGPWATNAPSAISKGSPALLGFNEPDLGSQANMPVAQAVASWKKYMQPYAGKARLISPAVTNGGSPMGLTYLQNFIAACTNCTIDAIAIHWYDSATNFGYLKWYMQQAYAAGGNRPIWLTEFGASGNSTQVQSFLKQALPFLDGLTYVERYAYFYAGASTGNGVYLANAAGTGLSDVGTLYSTL